MCARHIKIEKITEESHLERCKNRRMLNNKRRKKEKEKREINYNFLSSRESRFFTPLPLNPQLNQLNRDGRSKFVVGGLDRQKPKGVLANFGIVCKEAMRISLGEPTSHHGLGSGMRLRTVNDIPYGR